MQLRGIVRCLNHSIMARETIRLTLILSMMVVGLWAPVAQACSCVRTAPGACPDRKESGVSFVGTVLDVENPPDERTGADQGGISRYRFRVDENINGVDAKKVDVYSGRGGADCSFHFRLGETYFVTPYGDTFVDFEGSLNVILKRLRASLDYDPDTLPSGNERKTRPQLCPQEIPRRSSGEQGRGCGERQSQSDLSKSTPLPVKSAWKKTLAAQKREPLHQSLHRNR